MGNHRDYTARNQSCSRWGRVERFRDAILAVVTGTGTCGRFNGCLIDVVW